MVKKRRVYKKGAKKAASAHTCSVLKKKISSATTKSSRGKALGNFARHGCAARARRRNKR